MIDTEFVRIMIWMLVFEVLSLNWKTLKNSRDLRIQKSDFWIVEIGSWYPMMLDFNLKTFDRIKIFFEK